MAINQERNRSYQYLIDRLPNGKEKLQDRVSFLVDVAITFISERDINPFIKYSSWVINEIVLDYFADIVRLKDFHEIELTNPVKVASYTAYWIVKRKPLQIIVDPTEDELINQAYLENINEWFALHVLVGMVFNINNGYTLLDSDKQNKWNIFQETLVYDMVYRHINPQTLELALLGLTIDPPFNIITK